MNRESEPARAEPNRGATVSVIVPVLNEAAILPSCFAPVLTAGREVELIMVDAGSRDGSAEIARTLGATVLVSPVSQRAAQMNLGAQTASGDVLVFLHADTILPADWLASLRGELRRQSDALGGVFRRRFLRPSIFLRMTCWLADWRARQFGWFLGDQTIFVHRATFSALGGYRLMTAFEDLDFPLRLKKSGPTILLPVIAQSSGRRFTAKGPVRQTFADLRLTARFLRHRGAFSTSRTAKHSL